MPTTMEQAQLDYRKKPSLAVPKVRNKRSSSRKTRHTKAKGWHYEDQRRSVTPTNPSISTHAKRTKIQKSSATSKKKSLLDEKAVRKGKQHSVEKELFMETYASPKKPLSTSSTWMSDMESSSEIYIGKKKTNSWPTCRILLCTLLIVGILLLIALGIGIAFLVPWNNSSSLKMYEAEISVPMFETSGTEDEISRSVKTFVEKALSLQNVKGASVSIQRTRLKEGKLHRFVRNIKDEVFKEVPSNSLIILFKIIVPISSKTKNLVLFQQTLKEGINVLGNERLTDTFDVESKQPQSANRMITQLTKHAQYMSASVVILAEYSVTNQKEKLRKESDEEGEEEIILKKQISSIVRKLISGKIEDTNLTNSLKELIQKESQKNDTMSNMKRIQKEEKKRHNESANENLEETTISYLTESLRETSEKYTATSSSYINNNDVKEWSFSGEDNEFLIN